MDKNQENFLKELLNDFKIEASEHYQAIIDGLLVLEKENDATIQKACIEKVFREIHSLKGASRAVNLLDIEKLCMNLENIFNSLKKGEVKLSGQLLDVFYKANDLLNLLLKDVNQDKKNSGNYNLSQVIRELEFVHHNALNEKNTSESEEIKIDNSVRIILPDQNQDNNEIEIKTIKKENNQENQSNNNTLESLTKESQSKESQTVRISTEKLYTLLQQSEELITIKSTFEYFIKEFQKIHHQYIMWNRKSKENSIFSSVSNDTDLLNYLNSEKDFKKQHEENLYQFNKELIQFQRIENRMIDELLHNIKTTLLFPFSSMLGIFPKIVRDLSKEYSKNIDISIKGDNIEIDRRILEEIKDPLIHLIRNCVDHGIENEKTRKEKGKPAKGKIEINIIQNIDRKIEIHINDDGAGINSEKIINSAIKQGIKKPEELDKLTEKEIYSLIFASGISTSPFITDISGRGLGMAIVAEKVAKLGGNIEIDSNKDVGSNFVITLPQTLATFRGVLIESANQQFIIPSSSVIRAIRIQYSQIVTVESKNTIYFDNEAIALVVLSDVLKIAVHKSKKNIEDYLQVIILNSSQRKIAFVVDVIWGEQEGIVKDLGLQLSYVKNIAGATLLGSGKVVPILHPSELIDTASYTVSTIDYSSDNSNVTEKSVQKSILIAEDSITIRTLLRNFIESAGYKVKTAVDGLEAFNFLQNESYDLLVSDIEMPRMNGFELTTKVREDKKYEDLPVILVTALESADDKQKGMDVGANAYIVKSSFEKSNLIETIQRLI